MRPCTVVLDEDDGQRRANVVMLNCALAPAATHLNPPPPPDVLTLPHGTRSHSASLTVAMEMSLTEQHHLPFWTELKKVRLFRNN